MAGHQNPMVGVIHGSNPASTPQRWSGVTAMTSFDPMFVASKQVSNPHEATMWGPRLREMFVGL